MIKVLYRPACGGLKESMDRVKEFNSLKDMFSFISSTYLSMSDCLRDFYISYYCYDDRINWETYIITTSKMDGKNVCQLYGCPQAIGYCTFKEVD